jgi:cell division septation protein DedD
MRGLLLLMTSTLLFLMGSPAQDPGPDIERYLARVEKGEADVVRPELSSLLSKYPNNPDVLYLQGVLTTDGTEAVRIYQSIVDNFPKSERADDALYKVYQFYYAIGLYRTAEIKLNQLKTDYPQSKYVASVVQSNTKNLPEEKESPDLPRSTPVIQDPPIQPQAEKPTLPESEPSHPAVEERGQYTLQVGAFSQQVNAEKQKLFFEDLGYSVEVINKVRDSRALFVVLVGAYRTPDEAKTKCEEFKKMYNINSMTVMR